MKSEIKKLPKSLVEITITAPYDDYKKAEKSAVEEISKEIKVDGFRSGHIPEEIVREKVGDSDIRAVATENLVKLTYAQAVKEHNIQPIVHPKIDVKTPVRKEGDELVYTATVSVMPEISVGDYKKIKVARPSVKVEEKQIDDTIRMILDRFAEWNEVRRPAKNGDRAEADFEGFDEKGAAIPNTKSKNHPIILGDKTMVPGFEDAIIGMSPGEKKEFDIVFPKDYHAKNMQGAKILFKVTLNSLEEKKEKELDEATIEKITGQKQTADDFRKFVEKNLLAEMQHRAQSDHDNKVVQEIIKITKAELPDELISQEIEMFKNEQKERIKEQGLTWEQYLAHVKKTDEDFAKDHRKGAEERLIARLGVLHILKDSKIEVSDDEADKKIDEMISGYPKEYQEKAREYYKKGSAAHQTLKNNMAADKLIEMLSE
jgi:trigger factor